MGSNVIVGVVFVLVGGLLATIGLFLFIRTRMFISRAQEVKGTVIRMVYRHSSEGGGGYSPVYQFRAINGQMVEIQDSLSSNPPMFHEGQIIDVLYDPENPQKGVDLWRGGCGAPGRPNYRQPELTGKIFKTGCKNRIYVL
jgi:hypothetical protein